MHRGKLGNVELRRAYYREEDERAMPFRQVTRARNVNTSVVVGRAGKWRLRPAAAKRDKTSTKCVGFGRQAEYKPWHTFLTWGNVANFSPLLGRCRKTYALRTKNFAAGPRKVRQRRRTSLDERQKPFRGDKASTPNVARLPEGDIRRVLFVGDDMQPRFGEGATGGRAGCREGEGTWKSASYQI